MVQVTLSGINSGKYDYQNEKTGEDLKTLKKGDVVELIKRDILKGLVVSYPKSDFDIDDFV